MAFMLAPYNSAMRLGMGFNSYTQALCVNDVVRKPGNVLASEGDLRAKALTEKTDTGSTQLQKITPSPEPPSNPAILEGVSGSVARKLVDGQKEVSQVVTWTADFVENASEVLSKLNVSGALTIKLASLGKLSGEVTFVDATEIKKADVTYHIHVSVVNQRLVADNVTEFSPIDNIEPGQFTDIYGDCFISGFVEGGEFDALVSITTEDTLRNYSLGGGAKLEAKIGGFDVEGSASGKKTEDSHLKNAKTNISVRWSGGGDIREDTIKEWTLEKLKEVAMGFPDAVAACPQRVSAILTKYTSLRSYHEQTVKGSPLDYENAGVYTSSLYDAYTDYKIMWKEIQTMISRLNRKEIQLYVQNLPDGLKKYADSMINIYKAKDEKYTAAIEAKKKHEERALVPATGRSQDLKSVEKPLPINEFISYNPNIFGLEVAANDCRFEMIKIVREVDAVTKDPKVACDPERIGQYLSPSVFRLLLPTPEKDSLPTLEQWKATRDDLEKKNKDVQDRESEIAKIKQKLEAALITPQKDQNGTLFAHTVKDTTKLHPKIQESVTKHIYKADEYRMQSLLEDQSIISTGASFFNDLDEIQPNARPKELKVWGDDKKIKGIFVAYTAGKEIANGKNEKDPQYVLKLDSDEVITELEVHVVKSAEGNSYVTAIAVATSKCNILTAGVKSGGKTYNFSMAEHREWTFRGLFGFTFADGFEDLGVVWGKDTATATTTTVQMTPAKNLLGMGSSLQNKTKKSMSESKPTEHFYLGDCVSTGSTSSTITSFSALDTITGSSKIQKISFSASGNRLSGLRVDYSDGKQLTHGAYFEDQKSWACDVRAPIVAAKLTVGKIVSSPEPFVDTVELVCGDENGELPLWPLDVLTIRYLGDHSEADKLEVVSKLTEQAPKLSGANWTLRGFYGEETERRITRLGLIWGCV